MSDLYITASGDLAVSPNGDIGITQTAWRDDVQQAYIRMMTDEGDFVIYPTLGASLSRLYGQPQSPNTGQYGVNLIQSSFDREGRFIGKQINITPIPTSPDSIRFDVTIISGSRNEIKMSVEQDLGVQ